MGIKKLFILGAAILLAASSVCAETEVSVGGLIEVSYEKAEDEKGNLGVDAEIGIEAKLNEQVSGAILLKPAEEEIGDILDEAIITLENFSQAPISITAGKTGMPFGVFESHLISDPYTKEVGDICWEIGGVVGVFGNYAKEPVKVSLALYDSTIEEEPVAFACQLSASPAEGLTIGASYRNQKGEDGADTNTLADLSAMAQYAAGPVTIDVEYSGAMTREKDEPKPSAYSAGLSYQATEPLELAVRYDGFNDDDDTVTSPESRIGAGLNYTFLEVATLSAEIGNTKPEKDDSTTDFAAKLAIEF